MVGKPMIVRNTISLVPSRRPTWHLSLRVDIARSAPFHVETAVFTHEWGSGQSDSSFLKCIYRD